MWLFSKKKRNKKTSSSNSPVLFENRYADTPVSVDDYAKCNCFDEYYKREDSFEEVESDEEFERIINSPVGWSEPTFHVDERSSTQRAWDIACEILESAAKKGLKNLNLGRMMDRNDFMALNTLPESIGELKDLENLVLYGSNLSSIPREISGCEKLKTFEPYTSYRLHWFPYEIKRCRNLSDSCISTRALYGNYKMRTPFPDLSKHTWNWQSGQAYCSICNLESNKLDQYWISQVVATDVIPMLVSVCSNDCLEKVGKGAKNYVFEPHKGGLHIEQPAAEILYIYKAPRL